MLDGWASDRLCERLTASENTASGIGKSETYNPPKMVGWICPVCGRGLSPFTAVCPCKNDGKGWEITCKSE